MSAWLVSENHINALISFALDNHVVQPDEAEGLCRVLADENARSLDARYPGQGDGDEAKNYRFHYIADIYDLIRKRKPQLRFSKNTLAAQIVKACDCYDYQACETDDYDTTPAAAFVNRVREVAAPLAGDVDRDSLLWGLD